MSTYLEFEKDIELLENKMRELENFSNTHNVDVSQGIKILADQIKEARKNIYSNLTTWQKVQLARHPDRPYPHDYIQMFVEDFIELKGDRRFSDDEAIIGGFGKINSRQVMLIGTRKGRDLKSNVRFNFGCAHPEGYRKALRLMELANHAGVPIVALIDTPGAYPGLGAEERHIGEAIAVNLREMFNFDVPIVAVITGEGGSGGALGLGIGNKVLIMENAYYSVITPEGCAAILWRDGAKAPQAAEALKLTANDLKGFGIVDSIISEPVGGAHRMPEQAGKILFKTITSELDELEKMTSTQLRDQRYQRFRNIGVFGEEN